MARQGIRSFHEKYMPRIHFFRTCRPKDFLRLLKQEPVHRP
jgi:hypothetical protein